MASSSGSNFTITISTGTIVRIILFLLLAFALYYFRNLVLVILTSIVIASFVEPGALWLARFKIKRVLGVVIIYIISLSVLSAMFYALAPIVINETAFLLSSTTEYFGVNPDAVQSNGQAAISGAKDIVESISANAPLAELVADVRALTSTLSSGFLKTVSDLFGGIFNLLLIIVLSFYFSVQKRGIEDFLRIVTPLHHEEYVLDLWKRSRYKIGLWIRGQLLLGLVMSVLVFAGLVLLGVDYALLIAISVLVFELVPFGLILSIIPAVLLAYLDGGGSLAFLTGLFFLLIQQIETYVISPLIMNRVIGISPLVVILSVLIGAKAAGFWGLVLAIPVAVVILEFMDDVEKKKIPLRQPAQ